MVLASFGPGDEQCGQLVGFAVPRREIKNIASLGSQGQACLKLSSVETENNGASLNQKVAWAFLNQ